MRKEILYLAMITALVFTGVAVHAEESGQTSDGVETPTERPEAKPRPPVIQMIKTREMRSTTTPIKRPMVEMMRNSSTTEARENMGEKRMASSTIRTMKEEKRDKIEEKIKERREEMGKKKIHQFTSMIERFDKTITRLEGILGRLETRIAKIKAEGGDTTKTDGYVITTHTNIDLAKTSFLSLSDLANTVASTTGVNTKIASSTILQLRKLSDETAKHLKNAQKDMENAISNLKGGKDARVGGQATSTRN